MEILITLIWSLHIIYMYQVVILQTINVHH